MSPAQYSLTYTVHNCGIKHHHAFLSHTLSINSMQRTIVYVTLMILSAYTRVRRTRVTKTKSFYSEYLPWHNISLHNRIVAWYNNIHIFSLSVFLVLAYKYKLHLTLCACNHIYIITVLDANSWWDLQHDTRNYFIFVHIIGSLWTCYIEFSAFHPEIIYSYNSIVVYVLKTKELPVWQKRQPLRSSKIVIAFLGSKQFIAFCFAHHLKWVKYVYGMGFN